MPVLYTPHFMQFFDNNGDPLSGGKLYTYAAGTTTPKASYTTAAGTIENANPVVLDAYGRAVIFIEGAYRFDLFTSADVLVKSTDNVTSFNASTETNEGFFQSFSGDGATTAFTLSENLGTDERALFVFATKEFTTNGTFASDTGWTKGAGWTITSGVATATGAISTALEQTAGNTLVQGRSYSVKYTITQSAGSITLSVGGTAGTARSSSGTYSETIIAGSTQSISFGTSGFTGTLDNVTITETAGQSILNPADFTVNGTALTFTRAPAVGTGNIFVFAPYTLIGAAGAAQTAADAAIAAQAAAELAEANAETAEAGAEAALAAIEGLTGTSTTSLAIGTGGKSFTTQSGLGFIAGMWILATSDADPTNYMHGYVSSYSGTSLVMVSTDVGGSGTLADWTIKLSGTRGAQGPTGTISGASSATLVTNDKVLFLDTGTGDALSYQAASGIDLGLFGSGAATDGQVLTADGAGGAAFETLTIIPTGAVFPYAGSAAPTAYALCYGQELSRTTEAALFAVIGTTYGSGDGSTTFNVPDLRGRVPAGQDDMGGSSANRLTGLSGGVDGDVLGGTGGAESHTLTTPEIPAHTHSVIEDNNTGSSLLSPAVLQVGDGGATLGSGTTSSTGGGGAHNNVQPTIILNYIIKL